MKTKTKFLFIINAVLASAFLMYSCQHSTVEKSDQSSLISDEPFTVGIKTIGYETKGKLSVGKDGVVYLLHESPISALFGMEEWVDEEKIKVKYKGITWENEETETQTKRLYHVISVIQKGNPAETKLDSKNGKEAFRYSYCDSETKVNLWIEKERKVPLKIEAELDGQTYEINFIEPITK